LIDEDNIETGIGEVGGNATAIGARSEHRNFLCHY